MATCTFVLNGSRFTFFTYGGVRCAAFSGNGTHRNNPNSGNVPNNGSIPVGRYYIVDRASGGTLGGIRDWWSGKDQWFALYCDDGTIDDETFVAGVRRGEFRLHPKGPSGTSLGCITIESQTEFNTLRSHLLAQPASNIPGTTIRTYGIVTVSTPLLIDTLDPRYRRGGNRTEFA
jgi:hypothetical protein